MTVRNPSGPGQSAGYQGPRVGVQALPAVDATSIKASANRWGAAADIFTHVSSGWQQIVTRDAVELAKQEGARTAADATQTATVNGPDGSVEIQVPRLNKIDGYGAYAQAFNASARDTYGKRVELQARQSIKELEQKHQADPVGLEKALAALQPALLGDIEAQDPATATEVKFLYGALGTDAVLRAKDQALAVERDANQAATLQAIDTYQTSFSQHMREAGKGDPVAVGLAELDRAALENALVSHGPAIPYEVNGKKYPAGDGSLSAEYIQSQMIKLDREGAQQTQLGWWESGPQTAARADAWAKSNVPGITQDQKDVLHRSFLADADRAEAKAKAAANEAKAQAQADIAATYDDVKTSAANGVPVSPEYVHTILAAHPGAYGQKLVDGLYTAAQGASDALVINTQSVAEDEAMLKQLAPVQGQPTTKDAVDRYVNAARVVNEKHAALTADPAGYVQSVNPNVSALWDEVAKDPTNVNAMRAAIAETQKQQLRYGITGPAQAAMPKAIAEGITQQIMAQPTLGDQFATFMSYAQQADDQTTQAVMRDITAVKGGLPKGADIVADVAIEGGDRRLAEKMWSELASDTKGITLDSKDREQVTATLGDGILAVLQGQAAVKGDAADAIGLAVPLQEAAEQIAKARVAVGTDSATAAKTAAADLTGQFALISDPTFAQVYYSKSVENKNPGAFEAGLAAIRDEVAAAVTGDPYADATGRDIAAAGVWINHKSGFSLVVPGSNHILKHVTLDEVLNRGLVQQRDDKAAVSQSLPINYKSVTDLPSSRTIGSLNLTPQEQHLYMHHANNVLNGTAVKNPDGTTSTVYQAVVEHGGKFYNIPTVWDGKILGVEAATKRAAEKGWSYWPSYDTPDAADAWYFKMHDILEQDVK